jgi:hypothetical protein
MYKVLAGFIVVLITLSCQAQITIPVGGSSPSDTNRKSARITSRLLTGTVLDKSDKPVANAVVYLKNTKTLMVKTYIAQNDGTYRFPELSPNVDYDVYAEKDGEKSKTKTLSQFDDRDKANINLQINTNK